MPHQMLYALDTGAIVGQQSASTPEMLAVQTLPDGLGAVPSATGIPVEQRDAWVVQNGAIVAKTEAQLIASASPFAADGVSICTVTLTPFVPCTLEVNDMSVDLTPEDRTLELTSDEPQRFVITLAWHPTHWAAPLTVSAEEPT